MPRDDTSTNLPLCPLFMCKSHTHTHAHTHVHAQLEYRRSNPRENLIRPHHAHQQRAPYLLAPIQIKPPELPSSCGRGASSSRVAGRLPLPFRIKGRGPVRAQHDPRVRDTQMNMCQRHGNESRARGAWERVVLIRAVIKPCQEKEATSPLTSPQL